MRQIWIVALNTFKEVIRDRVLYALLVLAGLLISMSFVLGALSFSEQARILTDVGLVAAQFSCIMLAIFVGGSLVWREIEKQTVLTLLSKPVSRSQFIFGKVLGLGMVLILVDLLISIALAIIFQFFGQVFWYQFLVSQLGIILESLMVLCFAVFFGSFAKPVMTVVFTLSCWLIGHGVASLYYFSQKSESSSVKYLGKMISTIFPNLNLFNFKEQVVYGDLIPLSEIINCLLLWFAVVLVLLSATNLIFKKRDFI